MRRLAVWSNGGAMGTDCLTKIDFLSLTLRQSQPRSAMPLLSPKLGEFTVCVGGWLEFATLFILLARCV